MMLVNINCSWQRLIVTFEKFTLTVSQHQTLSAAIESSPCFKMLHARPLDAGKIVGIEMKAR
jgi:hypothetical protein